jgi:hypothetical protein
MEHSVPPPYCSRLLLLPPHCRLDAWARKYSNKLGQHVISCHTPRAHLGTALSPHCCDTSLRLRHLPLFCCHMAAAIGPRCHITWTIAWRQDPCTSRPVRVCRSLATLTCCIVHAHDAIPLHAHVQAAPSPCSAHECVAIRILSKAFGPPPSPPLPLR